MRKVFTLSYYNSIGTFINGGVWASLTLSLSPSCGSLSSVPHSHARTPQAAGLHTLATVPILQVFATDCCSNSAPTGSLTTSLQDHDKNRHYPSLNARPIK